MSEALGVAEVAEALVGEVLAARTAAQPSFVGLGPPDLCHVVKAFEPSTLPSLGLARAAAAFGAGGDGRRGSWHSVVGLDASSAAAVGAYVSELIRHQAPATWLAGGDWRVAGATYCWCAPRAARRSAAETRARARATPAGRSSPTATPSACLAAAACLLCPPSRPPTLRCPPIATRSTDAGRCLARPRRAATAAAGMPSTSVTCR